MYDIYEHGFYKVVCDTEEGVIGITPNAELYNYKVVNTMTEASEGLAFTLPNALILCNDLNEQLLKAREYLPGTFAKPKAKLAVVRNEETLN